MAIEGLGYVLIETAKPEEWDAYMLDIVGVMAAADPGDGAKHYRIDDRPFRFRIIPAAEECLAASAYRIDSAKSLADLRERIEQAGRPIEEGSKAEAALRGVKRFFSTSDPAGNGLEFYYGDSRDDVPFASPQAVSGFVTGDMGLGHTVLSAPDFEASHAFYKDIVGFHDTDIPHFKFSPDPSDPGMRFAFMHADNGRHHSIAIGEGPVPPSACVHMMLEMKSMLDVGRAHDRMRQAKIPESATLGKHVNDEMTSFYMQTPSGFDLEIGYEGLVIDPANWKPTAHQKISEWGHVWAWQTAMEEAAGEEAALEQASREEAAE